MSEHTPKSYRVLVIDDNDASAKTMGWMLEILGHQVQLAQDGAKAIAAAKSFLPEVILLDIGLPDMNGYEVCGLLKKDPDLQGAVIIAQTGWGQEEHRRRAKEAGFDHHLVKPVSIEVMEAIFANINK